MRSVHHRLQRFVTLLRCAQWSTLSIGFECAHLYRWRYTVRNVSVSVLYRALNLRCVLTYSYVPHRRLPEVRNQHLETSPDLICESGLFWSSSMLLEVDVGRSAERYSDLSIESSLRDTPACIPSYVHCRSVSRSA